MSELMFHPPAERLEAFVEDSLDRAERAVVESHLAGCSHCQREVAELRNLFAALSRLQHFTPAPGFMNRVMAHVRVPEPWWSRAGQYATSFLPRTSRGWAFASALLALPLVGMSAMMMWILSKPYVSGEGLVAFTLQQLGSQISTAVDSVTSTMIQSNVMLLFARSLEAFFRSGLSGAGAIVFSFAGLTALSAWVLYQNLFRTPTRRSDYVSYSI